LFIFPCCKKPFYLTVITDDYSRYILSAKLTEIPDPKENIKLLESVFNTYGLPKSYYKNYYCGKTDNYLKDYGLSKKENLNFSTREGKKRHFHSAYDTLQDNLVSECLDKNITDVSEAQKKYLTNLLRRIIFT
jgi:transposase InsO family protein